MTIPPLSEPHAATVDAVVTAANTAALSRRARTTRLQSALMSPPERRRSPVSPPGRLRRESPARKPYGELRVICNTRDARVADRYAIANVRKLAESDGVSSANAHARE
ncbi:hypothetical protein MELE44368_20515 [Mycolicibacterium elephantis DSM 44368]|uniref:Uncharacterized protein n=1 Tax=Mycolicibacterium elephantis DSM 44368 TaxID=1335622 RepID=A0A439DTK5_9MYCO|nr:hypothetical protein MELE44368_20515 [Mycolicibacterium elephantis DSM 44368]